MAEANDHSGEAKRQITPLPTNTKVKASTNNGKRQNKSSGKIDTIADRRDTSRALLIHPLGGGIDTGAALSLFIYHHSSRWNGMTILALPGGVFKYAKNIG